MNPHTAIIRKAKLTDVPQVVPLLREMIQYHHDLDQVYIKGSQLPGDASARLAKLIRKRNATLVVAEIDGKIVGYFVIDIRKTRTLVYREIGYISDGYVCRAFRRKGIGGLMLQWAKDWFTKRGIKRVELTVDTKNTLGVSAWQKYGFKEYQKKMWLLI